MKRRLTFIVGAGIFTCLNCLPLEASIEDYFPQKTLNAPSNYGETGLMEIPNAKFMDQASLRLNFLINSLKWVSSGPYPTINNLKFLSEFLSLIRACKISI